jgi:transcriptional regulator with XRE-family HTH domain
MRIGAIVKQRREACGWTQTQLAERTGVVTQALVSRIEGGEDNVTIDTLRGLARAFGCAVVDLLPEEDKKKVRSSAARAKAASAGKSPTAGPDTRDEPDR